MITKLVTTDSYDFGDASASLVPLCRSGVDKEWFTKRANADSLFSDFLRTLKPSQDRTVLHIIALGDEERYGCLAAGSPVVMADGRFKPIESVGVGDTVLTGYGGTGNVARTLSRTVDHHMKIRVEGLHEPITSSLAHPFLRAVPGSFDCIRDCHRNCKPGLSGTGELCLRGNGCAISDRDWEDVQTEFATADQLTTDDYVVFHMPTEQPPRHISREEGRLIGYWLAEGSFGKSYKIVDGERALDDWKYVTMRLCFGLHEEDTFVADAMLLAEKLGMKAAKYVSSRDNTCTVALSDCRSYVSDWLSWFGTGARVKRLPNWTTNLPQDVIAELLYGYMCGDGSVTVTDKESRAYASTASLALAYGVQRLFWAIGVSAVICENKTYQNRTLIIREGSKPARTENSHCYHVSYALEKAPTLLKFGAPPRDGTKIRNFVIGRRVFLAVREATLVAAPIDVYNLEVLDDHTYVAYNLCSHNCNRNCDSFSEEDNKRNHATFKQLGRVYRNHKHKDPTKSIGEVLATAHNDDMSRVELIVALNNMLCPKEADAAERGEDIPFSMGSSQQYDVCSLCAHKAPTAEDHCDHVKNHLGEVTADGTKIYMKNPNPKYFDISVVHKPADRIAYSLRKVASHNSVVGGHELAAEFGLSNDPISKVATMHALAEIIKEIPLTARKLTAPRDLSPASVASLRKAAGVYGLDQVLGFLNSRGLLLSPYDFGKVALDGHCECSDDESGEGLSDILEDTSEIPAFDEPKAQEDIPLPPEVVSDLESSCSMSPDKAQKRAIIVVMKPKIASIVSDPVAAHGFSMLYKHYKVAFAHHNLSNPTLVRSLAATF